MTDGFQPGVTLHAPDRASCRGPVLIHVTMTADMVTYYANHGVLDNALEVVLVRRDRPGVWFVLKLDPRALMLPDDPLSPPERDPSTDPSTVKEERTLDLFDWGVTHDGAGDYWLLAAFSRWHTPLQPLALLDRQRRFPAPPTVLVSAPPVDELARATLPEVLTRPGVAFQVVPHDDGWHVEGEFRVSPRPQEYPGEGSAPPFVTALALHLEPSGGAAARSFSVAATLEGGLWVGQFSLPFGLFLADPAPGHWRLLVFSGDEVATPVDLTFPLALPT